MDIQRHELAKASAWRCINCDAMDEEGSVRDHIIQHPTHIVISTESVISEYKFLYDLSTLEGVNGSHSY